MRMRRGRRMCRVVILRVGFLPGVSEISFSVVPGVVIRPQPSGPLLPGAHACGACESLACTEIFTFALIRFQLESSLKTRKSM